jgi:phenylacetate-CoA ligase
MNNLLARYLLFYPVRLIKGENVLKCLRNVKQVERMGKDDLRNYQWKKLKEIISYSCENIPYYKELLRSSKLSVKDINAEKDLLLVPVLSKNIIRQNLEKFKNTKIKKLQIRSTSGSTGNPLIFYKDRFATAYMDAVMYHSYSWHGINIGDKQARFWGMPIDKRQRTEAKLKDFFMNRIRLSAFNLDYESLFKFYNKMLSFSPNYFYGYPSLIYQFALFLQNNNINTKYFHLKAIVVTGELIMEYHKKKIEEVFKCRVVNEYGCSEMGIIAFECTSGNMHLMAHNIFVEVVNDGKHVLDEEGEIYVTELNSKSYPFIRYRLGDRGILLTQECTCGLKFPLIRIKEGRIDDYIITPDGRKIYDAVLAYTFKKGIDSFQAIQRTIDNLDIYISKNNEFNCKLERNYLQSLQNKLGEKMNITFIYVDEIAKEKSGKLRYFKSEIKG